MPVIDDLERLGKLRERGLLSDNEFHQAKRFVLTVAGSVKADAPLRPHDCPTGSAAVPAGWNPAPVHPAQQTCPLGLTGFILGLASIPFYVIGIVPILAVTFSAISLYRFDERTQKNRWMALTGLTVGAIGLAIFGLCVFMIFFAANGQFRYVGR